jgi:hypothetical protein
MTTIFAKKHDKFRTAVVSTMRQIAVSSIYVYDKDKQLQSQYIDNAVDVAFGTILNCFDNDIYMSLTDTATRRYAKSEIMTAIDLCDKSVVKIDEFIDDHIDGESVFDDIETMLED